jgi:co-chaperonin GroES (HSP10)
MDIEKFKPINAYVLIEEIETEKETKSGFVITDTDDKKKIFDGIVVKIGNGVRLADGTYTTFSVEPGDIVKFRKGLALKIEQKYYIVFESDIVGIISRPEDKNKVKFISDLAVK